MLTIVSEHEFNNCGFITLSKTFDIRWNIDSNGQVQITGDGLSDALIAEIREQLFR